METKRICRNNHREDKSDDEVASQYAIQCRLEEKNGQCICLEQADCDMHAVLIMTTSSRSKKVNWTNVKSPTQNDLSYKIN